MYHPSRGGVRGGRDQFNWDDVKGDKHRENYLGHSLKAPVGRWQKGKDLMWYARDGKQSADEAAVSAREEIERVKQEEEEAMREALGLAPRRDKPRVNRLDKREQEELLKRSKTGEEVEKPYAQGERVQGLGFAPVTKSLAPDKKDLLQREAAPEEERPLVQIISPADIREAEKTNQEPRTDAVKEDSRQVSDDLDKKRKRKEEKRAAKEHRREVKRAAKKMKREKRRRQTSTGSDEDLTDKKVSGAKLRRHESDSSDEDHGHTLRRKDARANNTLGDKRNTTIHESDSSDDGAPRPSRRTRDEIHENMQNRPPTTRVVSGRRDENLGRDSRNIYDDDGADKNGRRIHDRTVEERERKYGRSHDSSPRQRHNRENRDDRENNEKDGKYSGAYNRELTNSRRRRDEDSDEDSRRRHKGGNDFRSRDELSRRQDLHHSKDAGSHRRRSLSPVRRKSRQDSD